VFGLISKPKAIMPCLLEENNPTKVLDNNFYTIAEVYNYNISAGKNFDFGDKKVNYFENGFNNMINFEFKYDAKKDYEFISQNIQPF
jgi:alpha-amylase